MATAVREARGLITAGTTTLHGTQALIASLVAKITALRSRPTVLLGAVVTTHHNPPTTRRVGEVTVRHVQPTAHLVGVVIAHPAEEGAAVGRVTAVVVEGGAPTVADTHAKRTLGLRYPAPTKRGWAASPARNFNSATIVDLYRVYCMAQAKVIGYSAKRKFLPISRFIFPGTR